MALATSNAMYVLHPQYIRDSFLIKEPGKDDIEMQREYFAQLFKDHTTSRGYQMPPRRPNAAQADLVHDHPIVKSSKLFAGSNEWKMRKSKLADWKERILKEYKYETDWYFIDAFGCSYDINDDKKKVSDESKNIRDHQFRVNPFPHPMNDWNISHDCMWYHTKEWAFDRPMTMVMERKINVHIIEALGEKYGHFDFGYFWRVNPTPSMKKIFHVHVYHSE